MVGRLALVPCHNCGRECRMTEAQSRSMRIVFCGGKCEREFIRKSGEAQKKIAMQYHAENLGIPIEDLIL